MRCLARWVLPTMLILTSAPATAFAQSLVCQTIRRGESAADAARRLTGDSRNTYQTWFQIMNASSRFVPKSQYVNVRAGWRACVIKPAGEKVVVAANRDPVPDAPLASAPVPQRLGTADASALPGASTAAANTASAADVAERARSLVASVVLVVGRDDLTVVWMAVALVVPWVGWRMLDRQLTRRKTTTLVVRHFAHRFVDEFERPLVRHHGQRAVRSQLRMNARRGRFDILLSPGAGRRYPNLSDHKKNVEYDVARVMQLLADRSFVHGRPYMQGSWVVLPFRFTADRTSTGVSCISSL